MLRVVKFIVTESRAVATRAGEGDNGELMFNGPRVSVLRGKGSYEDG